MIGQQGIPTRGALNRGEGVEVHSPNMSLNIFYHMSLGPDDGFLEYILESE